MASHLAARDLAIELGGTSILHGLTAHARSGEFVGLIGPNGAGKSTLLRALAATLPPSAGEVRLDGAVIGSLAPRQLAMVVAAVPQNTTLTFAFTAAEVALLGRHPHLRRFAVEGDTDLRIARDALARTGMAAFADRSFPSLSGGERQLVLLAKALAQQPRILLLDEPISALDIRHQLAVLQLVAALTEAGVVAVAALHDLNLAARFCTRLVLMAGGRVLADGTPAEVLTPDALGAAYGVRVAVRTDPDTAALVVTALDLTNAAPHPPVDVRGGRT